MLFTFFVPIPLLLLLRFLLFLSTTLLSQHSSISLRFSVLYTYSIFNSLQHIKFGYFLLCICICVSLSVYLCIYITMLLCIYVCVSLSVHLYLSVCVFVSELQWPTLTIYHWRCWIIYSNSWLPQT